MRELVRGLVCPFEKGMPAVREHEAKRRSWPITTPDTGAASNLGAKQFLDTPSHLDGNGSPGRFLLDASMRHRYSPLSGSPLPKEEGAGGGVCLRTQLTSICEAEAYQRPQRCEAIAPGDLLALGVVASGVINGYLIDAIAAFEHLGRDLRLEVEAVAADLHAF